MVKAKEKITSTFAREADQTIKLSFFIPSETAQKIEDAVTLEFGKNISIKGFRKGFAPLTKIRASVDRDEVVTEVVNRLMPYAMADAIAEHKIKPIIPAQVHILKTEFGKNWELEALTCELPVVKLGDYQKEIKKVLTKKPKNKDEAILKTILKVASVSIPNIIIDNEINERLTSLLKRLEKLGLTLEKYLQSANKKPEDFYKDLQKEVKDSISLEIILNEIALDLKVKVDQKEVKKALGSMKADPNFHIHSKKDEERQIKVIELVLARRGALSLLSSL